MRTRVTVMCLVVLACVGLASCSDDDDDGASGTGGGERLTAAQLATRGDAVCNELDAEVKKLAADFDQTIIFTPEQMQTLYTKLVPLVDDAIEDFQGLEPPTDLEAKYDAAIEQMKVDRQKLVDASKSKEAAKTLFDGGVDPFQPTNEKLAAAGITACSEDSPTGDGAGAAGDTTIP